MTANTNITYPWSSGSLSNTSRSSVLTTPGVSEERTCIIGTDHQHNISVGEVLIDFVHLEHNYGPASVYELYLFTVVAHYRRALQPLPTVH